MHVMDRDIRKLLKPVAILGILIIASSVIFFILSQLEGRSVSLLDCVYMVTITISTVGYEDLLGVRDSVLLKGFSIVAIFAYMVAVAYAVSNFTAFMVEGRLKRFFLYRLYMKRIEKMDRHVIICGVRDVGQHAAAELAETGRPFVVIDESPSHFDSLRQSIPSLIALEGDATDDHILQQAGIERAEALIASLDNDKENLFLVLTAKELNPEIKIAARFDSPRTQKKLKKAGAAFLVSPHMIGGLRMASEIIRPHVVTFLDRMLRHSRATGIRVEEVTVPEGSSYIGKAIEALTKATGALIISLQQPGEKEFTYNPSMTTPIAPGMTLVFIAGPALRACVAEALGLEPGGA